MRAFFLAPAADPASCLARVVSTAVQKEPYRQPFKCLKMRCSCFLAWALPVLSMNRQVAGLAPGGLLDPSPSHTPWSTLIGSKISSAGSLRALLLALSIRLTAVGVSDYVGGGTAQPTAHRPSEAGRQAGRQSHTLPTQTPPRFEPLRFMKSARRFSATYSSSGLFEHIPSISIFVIAAISSGRSSCQMIMPKPCSRIFDMTSGVRRR